MRGEVLYKYYTIGKNYAFRKALQKIRFFIILAVPVGFLLVPAKSQTYLCGLFVLGLVVLGIDFYRGKKIAGRQSAFSDWFVIIGTNLYIGGLVFLTSGLNSPFNIMLILPTLFFTIEFGFSPGIVSLIFLFMFIGLSIFIEHAVSLVQLVTGFSWLFITSLIFAAIFAQNKILTRYHSKMKKLFICDELTGLFNRRHLKDIALEAIKHPHPFTLIMLDINFFKYYNDQWGHSRGNTLLKSFGRFLQLAVKDMGTVIRISGDEFIIFIPLNSLEHINETVERIQNLLSTYPFPGEECFPQKKLSISLGVVSFPEHATSFDELLEKVDQNLYQNKKLR
jgi:diguanylate cyclase (GGDEF)-like protein